MFLKLIPKLASSLLQELKASLQPLFYLKLELKVSQLELLKLVPKKSLQSQPN